MLFVVVLFFKLYQILWVLVIVAMVGMYCFFGGGVAFVPLLLGFFFFYIASVVSAGDPHT